MIRVSFYGRASVLAKELRIALSTAEGFSLVSWSLGEQMPSLSAAHRPDVILLDVSAEFVLDSVSMLQSMAPSSSIVLWMGAASPEIAFKAIHLGVRGAVLQTASIGAALRCLTKVSEGELWFDKSLFGGGPALFNPRTKAIERPMAA